MTMSDEEEGGITPDKSGRTPARAHARTLQPLPGARSPDMDPAELTTKRARVIYVVQLMLEGRFETGVTYHELASLWDISTSTVRDITSTASHVVQLSTRQGAKAFAAEALARYAEVIEDRLVDAGDRDAASLISSGVSVSDRLAKLTGADEPTRSQVQVTDVPEVQQFVQRASEWFWERFGDDAPAELESFQAKLTGGE